MFYDYFVSLSHATTDTVQWFPFDFIFFMAEVKCCKLDEVFNNIALYFAGTLYSAKRVSCNLAIAMCTIYVTVWLFVCTFINGCTTLNSMS